MASLQKIFDTLLTGRSDQNVNFSDLKRILRRLGFTERTKGSHFIYTRSDVVEMVNIQEGTGGKAKPYQVKQIRAIITQYGLGITGAD